MNIVEQAFKMPDYYKNILEEDNHLEFVQILSYIKELLTELDTNLIYTEKIVSFINNEFNINGAFPMELMFVNQFMKNSVDIIILSSSKLIFDHGNIQNKKTVG